MKLAALLLTLAASATLAVAQSSPHSDLPSGVRILFSPVDDIENEIVKLIDGAKAELLIHEYVITSPALVKSLIEAKDRGVVIMAVLEANPPFKNYETPSLLQQAGIAVRLSSGKGKDNNRYIVIDGDTVQTGSYEWTKAAKSGRDNAIVIINPGVAEHFTQDFRDAVKSAVRVPVEATASPTPGQAK